LKFAVPGVRLNVAITPVSEFIVTVHVDVPVHAPDQPANVEPAGGAAVSVTDDPTG
jgi:hypothetical protein